jgi:hypothetical protein
MAIAAGVFLSLPVNGFLKLDIKLMVAGCAVGLAVGGLEESVRPIHAGNGAKY